MEKTFSELNQAEMAISDAVSNINVAMSGKLTDYLVEDLMAFRTKLEKLNVELIDIIEAIDPNNEFNWSCRG